MSRATALARPTACLDIAGVSPLTLIVGGTWRNLDGILPGHFTHDSPYVESAALTGSLNHAP